MAIGSAGVSNYANTSSSQSTGVYALFGMGGSGISAFAISPYAPGFYISTQAGDIIATQNNDLLVTN